MNIEVNMCIEAIKIAENALIRFKGNLVAGCIMLYRTCIILASFYCFKKFLLVGEFLLPVVTISCLVQKEKRYPLVFFSRNYDRMGWGDFFLTPRSR